MKTYKYVTPNGTEITRSLERLQGGCGIVCFDENGTPEHDDQGTEVFWDCAEQEKRDGKLIYMDEDGDEFTLDQCERIEFDPATEGE